MSSTSENNKRIAKNTALLYVRMIILMGVTLYTSRVVLHALGVDDYGIYNVVGGVVSLFAFFTSSLSNATQRFLNIELGKGDMEGARKVFNQSLELYSLFSIFVLIVGETLGLWFVSTQLVVPVDRIEATIWTFQCSLLMSLFSIMQVPYLGVIIAREKMSLYAYLGIIDVVAKLVVVYVLLYIPSADSLELYASLLLAVHVLISFVYAAYCHLHFEECRLRFVWETNFIKQFGRFIGYNLFGCFAYAGGVQGTNIVLNLFFGPAVNAARAVGMQVSGAISRFTDSVMTAIKPQIIKSYAANNNAYMLQLVEYSSKYMAFLMFVLAIPIVGNIDLILELWLQNPPEYSNVFVALVVVESFFGALLVPFWIVANATGNIKRSQVYGRMFTLIVLPVSYAGYKLGLFSSPAVVFYLLIIAQICYWVYSLYDIHRQVGFSYIGYLNRVLKPIFKVAFVSIGLLMPVYLYTVSSISRLVWSSLLSEVVICTAILVFGIDQSERNILCQQIKKLRNRQ